ncbi:MAG: hypothetical protein LUC18_04700 [Porphyromonadaceae bacterium]|nr:hypothetical protein [Porphyromonadaceae bacterium]
MSPRFLTETVEDKFGIEKSAFIHVFGKIPQATVSSRIDTSNIDKAESVIPNGAEILPKVAQINPKEDTVIVWPKGFGTILTTDSISNLFMSFAEILHRTTL